MASAPATNAAFVLINGHQLLVCHLPTQSERACTVFADVQSNLQVMHDSGRFELTCLYYCSSDMTGLERPWTAVVVVDDSEKIELGMLPHVGESRVVSRYLKGHPTMFCFEVRFGTPDFVPHPEEDALATEVQLLVLARNSLGLTDRSGDKTVRLSKIQAKLEPLKLYERVVKGHYGGNFHAYVVNQAGLNVVTAAGTTEPMLLVPTPDSITPELRSLCDPEGGGAKASDGSGSRGSSSDSSDSASPELVEQETVAAVVSILEDKGELTVQQLLAAIIELVPAWQRRNLKASSHVFVRFLQSRDSMFWVKWDPVETSRVGLVREGSEPGPASAAAPPPPPPPAEP